MSKPEPRRANFLVLSLAGLAHKGTGRREGRHPACTAAVDLWWEADVRILLR